jgi:hypothetical protein
MTPGNERVAISAPPGRVQQLAARSWTWLKSNLDTAVALSVAAFITVLDMVSTVDQGTMNNAVIVVLGLLAYSVVRDRGKDEARDKEIAAAAGQADRSMARLSAELAGLSAKIADLGRILEDSAEIRVLRGPQIEDGLAAAHTGARNWLLRGGAGTEFRTVTLPRIVTQAQAGAHPLSVRLEILDPTDSKACDQYAFYRQSLGNGAEPWDGRQVERECYATILACCWHWQHYPRLRLEIRLSPIVRTMLWDLSDDALFITQESSSRAVLAVAAGRVLYDYVRTELDISFDHARDIGLGEARSARLSAGNRDPSHNEVRRLFDTLRLPLPVSYGDADIADIVQRALHAKKAGP